MDRSQEAGTVRSDVEGYRMKTTKCMFYIQDYKGEITRYFPYHNTLGEIPDIGDYVVAEHGRTHVINRVWYLDEKSHPTVQILLKKGYRRDHVRNFRS